MKNDRLLGIFLFLFMPFCCVDFTNAIEPTDTTQVYTTRSCVNVFENSTVSSIQTVTGCDSLIVRDVTVANIGNLTLSAPGDVVIYGDFEVVQGGILTVNEENVPVIFNFTYDESGNRVSRKSQVVQ